MFKPEIYAKRTMCFITAQKMFKPEKYAKYGKVQANLNSATLKKYEKIAYWKTGNCESVIDLGSGDGSFTSNTLVKFIPDDCKKIVGSDKYNDMVQYANKHHKTNRISFAVLDAEGSLPGQFYESFNQVFSFYALQLASNQRKVFTNIYNLLTTGGSCFVTMVGYTKMPETYATLYQQPKWKKWLSNVGSFVSSYGGGLEPAKTLSNMMTDIGFSDVHVEFEEIIYEFKNINEFKDLIASVDVTTVPEDLYDDFVKDYVEVARANGLVDENLRMKWEIIIAFAIKNDNIR